MNTQQPIGMTNLLMKMQQICNLSAQFSMENDKHSPGRVEGELTTYTDAQITL